MSFDKCLGLLFSLMILGQAYWMRRRVGTWLFPACIFGLFWFGYTFIPLVVLFWVPVDPYAMGFIFLCTVAFSTGSLPFDWKTAFQKNMRKRETTALVYAGPFLKSVFYLASLASLVFVIINTLAQGFSLSDYLYNFYYSVSAFADMRYTERLTANIYGPMGTVCAYVGVILGGLLFPSEPTKRGRGFIIALSFLPAILEAVIQLSKGLLFLCVIYFYAGLLLHRVSTGRLRLLEKGSIKSLMLSTAVLILIVTISIFSRGLWAIEDSAELTRALVERYMSYAFGHIYAFCDWFAFIIGRHSEVVYSRESIAYGFYTFAPLFRLIGSQKELPLGIYDEYYSFGNLSTNIYTMFRGLVQDFGAIGCIFFMLTAGLLLHWAFHTMLRNRRPVFTVAVFVFMTAAFYASFGLSLLIWNSAYVTFAFVLILLYIDKWVTQEAHRRLTLTNVHGGECGPLQSQPSRP